MGFWADDESEGLANLVGTFVDSDYDYDDFDYNLTGTAFYFQPSLYFRSPIIHLGRNAAVALCATPWMRISTKHHDYYPWQATDGHWSEAVYRSRTVAAGVTAGPTLRLGALGISVSYQISNMDVTRPGPRPRQFCLQQPSMPGDSIINIVKYLINTDEPPAARIYDQSWDHRKAPLPLLLSERIAPVAHHRHRLPR